jgi:hypothetical protein
MLDDPEKLSSWITEAKRKFTYFTSPVTYLMVALAHLEKLNAENKILRDALQDLKSDIDSSTTPTSISYDRDTLSNWLGHVLQSSLDVLKKDSKNGT